MSTSQAPVAPADAPAPSTPMDPTAPPELPHHDAGSPTSVDPELLEAEICELAAKISVATARLIVLISEFDTLEKWVGAGLKSCAHWLSWRCHVDLHTAREQVRVARALRCLPLITAAFGAGQVSYTKVRALTRIATPDCEADLVELAKSATAPQVERTVAGWRRADSTLQDDIAKQEVSWYFAADGMLVVRARLTAEDGAVLVAALEAMQTRLERSEERADAAAGPPTAEGPPGAEAATTAGPPGAEAATAGGPPNAELLPPVVSRLDALLGLARAYLTGGEDGAGDPDTQLLVSVDAAVLQQRAEAGLAQYQAGGALTNEQVRRLACDTRLVLILKDGPDVLDVGRSRRTIPRSLRHALWARDRGCSMPGCTENRQRRLHAHHIIHWADGGPTCLENLIMLCGSHHRGLHEGGFALTWAGGTLHFLNPMGQRLDPSPRQPALAEPELLRPLRQFAMLAGSAQISTGERMQLEWVVSTLQGRRDNRRAQRARWEQQLAEQRAAA